MSKIPIHVGTRITASTSVVTFIELDPRPEMPRRWLYTKYGSSDSEADVKLEWMRSMPTTSMSSVTRCTTIEDVCLVPTIGKPATGVRKKCRRSSGAVTRSVVQGNGIRVWDGDPRVLVQMGRECYTKLGTTREVCLVGQQHTSRANADALMLFLHPNIDLDGGVEKDRGFENPEGMVEGYGRVGVRVQMLLPPTNPYPSRGSRGSRGYRRGR
ncbi:hypothetical protein V8E53_008334 [Lactarius tabidus]